MAGSRNPAPEVVKASVWRRPYSARERITLHIQAKYDRRNVPALWLWRLNLPDEDNGPDIDETLWESSRLRRQYHDPIAAHIYIDWAALEKKYARGGTSTTGVVSLGITRAEARRLGGLWSTRDDLEGLVGADLTDDRQQDCLYLPRPGDIFRYGDDHYGIQQWRIPRRYGPTSIIMTWHGTAAMLEEDVAAPGFGLKVPLTPQPPVPASPRYSWRG